MREAALTVAACTTLLWVGTALATPTAQQNCDSARITAWKVYTSCVDTVVAKDAKTGGSFDEFAAFAECRHRYFKNWTTFQSKASLNGTACQLGLDNRFTEDLIDGVVTDNLSGLVWELKDNLDGATDYTDPHDADNYYSWSTGAPYAEIGTAFTDFLAKVNGGAGFGGANGWRLPTLAELQTIVLDFPCTGLFASSTCRCPSEPCVDPALDAANTQSYGYWSATSYFPGPRNAWRVHFSDGFVYRFSKTFTIYVRAVRGGL